MGIFVDSTDFRPSFRLGNYRLTINGMPYATAVGEAPYFVFGNCGAHSGSYFEGHLSLSFVAGGGSVAVGIHDAHLGSVSMDPVCAALQKAPEDCVPFDFKDVDPTSGLHTECLTSAPAGGFRRTTPVAAVIMTRELTQDMFQPPYWEM
ncbi:hypothetical protein [Streptomyces sp. NPDC093568]|uniref:hypothetical protein n=1 Tax=Streptomyces sp. NPDC093568 TaxID=3366041 RepID=UPI0037F2AAA2